jgi:hypothetical protein
MGRAWWRGGGACLLLILAVGCGGKKATVTGTVSYKGQPLKGGTVVFLTDPGGHPFRSEISQEGKYTINGVPPGSVKITVSTASLRPPQIPRNVNMPTPPKDVPLPPGAKYNQTGDPSRYTWIPDNYGDPEKSGLAYTVQPGEQTHNIDLAK